MLVFKVGTLSRYLGVHRNTITNWIRKGKLQASPTTAKRYTISKNQFIQFCDREHIAKETMESVIQGTSDPVQYKDQSPVDTAGIQKKDELVGAVMIVGGGIAGIQSAMDLADSGYYVYLIEKTAGIGGTMAQLDKTFPTNDCASCIVLPKLVGFSRHRNIELLTLSQVDQVKGRAGNFNVRIKKRPRYIDTDKCIACGVCAQKCPTTVTDEFNFNISRKKAIYIRYDQSVPHKYAIDPDACLYFKRGKCRACDKFCPTGAVNFTQMEKKVTINVGAVILAMGFKPFDPSKYDFFGYHMSPDVVTSLEYERLLSVSGPNRGMLQRPSDRMEPRKIAWLLCVGSRNQNNCGNSYCSSICCMSAVKQSMNSPEHIKGQDLERTIFFLDLRSYGKESERYFEQAKKENIKFLRASPHTMEPGIDGTGVRIRYMDETGRMRVDAFDMAVLSIGFEAPEDARLLADKFGIQLDRHEFANTSCFEPVASSREGVYAVGAFQAPKAISRSVVQASAAAAAASSLLTDKRGSLVKTEVYPIERDICGRTPCIGVFVCSCGMSIAGTIDVDQLVEYAAGLPHVVHVENNLFSCSTDAQESIIEKIVELGLNRIVIAACTPKTHEHLFQETLKSAQLNGFMVEIANIRNQNSWVHQTDSTGAMQKAKAQVRMAVAKVTQNYPLEQDRIKVIQKALIVGGGVVGMNSALTLSGLGIETVLIEKSGFLGGNALKLETCFKGEAVNPMLEDLISRVIKDKRIRVYKKTVIESVSGSVGNFKGRLNISGTPEDIFFGAAVMATGAEEARPEEYLYGKVSRVMTHLEFDANVLYRPGESDTIKSVVFIQCVGSREPQRPYCSRVCCIHSVKAAIRLKQINPGIKVYILYREIRTYGEWESYYNEARALGVLFIRYETDRKPVVEQMADFLKIDVIDPIVRRPVRIKADYLVLASGVVASENKSLSDLFKFSVNSDGFFNGAHPKLKPVDLSVAGLFLAGICNYPKPLDESIEQARAAAYRAFILLSKEEIQSEAVKSFVTDMCDACGLCVAVCPFHALSIAVPDKNTNQTQIKLVTDPGLCQGCGLCAATCPKEGIMIHGFTKQQLMAQVKAAINEAVPGEECR